jgi:hypothetical protein
VRISIRGVMASDHGKLPIGGRLDGARLIPRIGETAAMAVLGMGMGDPMDLPHHAIIILI